MSHLDDDAIARAAMGEAAPAERDHLAACTPCADQVASLTTLMEQLSAATPGLLVAPPPRVWDAITAQIAADGRDAADVSADDVSADDAPAVAPSTPHAVVVPLARDRRTVAPWWLAAAASAGVVLGVGVTALVQSAGSPAEPTVYARASLADLGTSEPAGSAVVEVNEEGNRVLVVDTTQIDLVEGYLEVWLIDPEVDGMVSIGFLNGPHGEFELPAGLETTAFPIVDISIEHHDGVPTHSGDSIIRGTLDA
jgi:hypothetical protein